MKPVVLVLLAACGRIGFDATTGATGDGPSGGDGVVATCAAWAMPPSNFPLTSPTDVIELTTPGNYMWGVASTQIAGPTGSANAPGQFVTQAGAPTAWVATLGSLHIAAGVNLDVNATVGDPLVFIVYGPVQIDGAITVRGSGGACTTGLGGDGTGAGSSGGGGAFGAFGGGGSGGAAGTAEGNAMLIPLREGCRGGAAGGSGGAGGSAGGAIQISSCGTVAIAGTISAPGLGGVASPTTGRGGGGGGSGGAILIEASALALGPTAAVCANGASGGEGDSAGTASSGVAGTCLASTPAITPDTDPAGNGGSGGDAQLPAGGAGVSVPAPGGGGGGSVGRIRFNAAMISIDPSAIVTPTAG